MNAKAEKPISKRQIKKIHTLAHAAELTDREYRLTLFDNYRVGTCKVLSHAQAEHLIAGLERVAISLGNWERREGAAAHEYLGQRPGMASPAQLRKVEVMWKDVIGIRDRQARNKALRTWLDRHFHVSDLRFLSETKVRKVLYALNAMKERKG